MFGAIDSVNGPPNYFAYGSNMDLAQMRRRCPAAELWGAATLPDWRFRINARGVATIVPEVGSRVHGLAWRLTPADEVELDK